MIEITVQGILLGLSTGLACLGYCAPVFVPYMMSEDRKTVHSARVVGELALGRLVAYLAVGAAAGYIGLHLEGVFFQKVIGAAMIALSLLLIFYAVTRIKPQSTFCRWMDTRSKYFRYPLVFGLLTGFNVCPPFLLAISYTLGLESVVMSVIFFGGFFVGTAVYIVIFLPLGYLGRWEHMRVIALLTALLSGGFFFFLGVIRLVALGNL